LLVKPEADKLLKNGNTIRPQDILREDVKEVQGGATTGVSGQRTATAPNDTERVRMCTSDGQFLGLYEFSKTTRRYEPVKMFMS
ncbi:MAG: hypothetical protein J6W66_03975, partial [Lachnospiraceae bacterium]|nr:hypothetical protein [Lachnospiraceae bacterium]